MRDNATKDINNTGKKSDGSDDDSDDVWDSDEYGDEDSNSDDDHDSQSNDAVDGGSTKRANEDPEMIDVSLGLIITLLCYVIFFLFVGRLF